MELPEVPLHTLYLAGRTYQSGQAESTSCETYDRAHRGLKGMGPRIEQKQGELGEVAMQHTQTK